MQRHSYLYLSGKTSQVSFHVQEKQKAPCFSAWVNTAMFGKTSFQLEGPMFSHRSNIKTSRTASTVLNSYFIGTDFREEAGAMTGAPGRQRSATALPSHLENSASNLDLKCSWFSVKLLCSLFGHRGICPSLFLLLLLLLPYFFLLS